MSYKERPAGEEGGGEKNFQPISMIQYTRYKLTNQIRATCKIHVDLMSYFLFINKPKQIPKILPQNIQ